MDIIEIARTLGKAIQEDERFINTQVALQQSDADEDLQRMIGEFNLKRMSINNEAQKEDRSEELLEKYNNELREIYAQIMQNPHMHAYNTAKNELDALVQQQSIAEVEVTKPFPQEEELKTKSARLAELDACLNIDGRPEPAAVMDDQADEIAEKRPPRTLSESLRVPCQPGKNKSKKDRTEVR